MMQPEIHSSEFIDAGAPYGGCHASTLVETPNGLLAAWFAGTDEGENDVEIWVSRHNGAGWSTPRPVADGKKGQDHSRWPCWNPVLHRTREGLTCLFYKVGPSPRDWWGLYKTSHDDGDTWSPPQHLPDGILGPIKNKPLELEDGTLVCGSSTEHDGWRTHIERLRLDANGRLLERERTASLNTGREYAAIQPTLLRRSLNHMVMLCRTKQGCIVRGDSQDNGRTWSHLTATTLPNPNSGIDAVALHDCRVLLVYNPAARDEERGTLALAVSEDLERWSAPVVLDHGPREYSYPAVIQTADGRIHITYTWRRERIKHLIVAA